LSSAAFLVSAIADALDFSFAGAEEPQTQLLNYLQGKEMLLVLDGFEHLLEGATLLSEILKRAPEVKIVVTSRERLRLQAEWVLPVGKLPFPGRFVTNEIQEYSAVRLFLDRARRRDARFTVSEENSAAIVQICRLVGGMPLGIELAAASVADQPCAQIAAQIEGSLDFLKTSFRDVPQRHRSVRAVFEHSWNLLSAEEQAVLQKLSVFRGGFEAQAAREVAGASPRMLTALVDKSLVQGRAGDRYQVHELLRQYAAEGLDGTPGERQSVLDRHCDYYTRFLQEKAKDLQGDRQQAALAAIRIEIENLRLAWQRAVDQVNWDALERALFGLQRFYDISSWFQEGLAVFSSAAANLERGLGPAEQLPQRQAIVLGNCLSRQGWFSFRLGRSQEAKAFLQRALVLFRHVDARRELGQVCNDLGIITYRLGEYATAKELYEESLAMARQLEDHWKAAVSLLNLGNVSRATGEYDQARQFLQEGLAIMREQGDPYSTANCLNNLGEVARVQEEYAAARQYYQESLDLRRQVGDRHGVAVSLHNLGEVANALGTYDDAKKFFDESLSIFTELDSRRESAYPLSGLGDVACSMGAYSEALAYYQSALRISTEMQNAAKVLDVLTQIAQVQARAGRIDRAVELLVLVAEHPRASTKTRDEAGRILTELEAEQPEGTLDTWRAREKLQSFEEAVGELLALS
jgi:predicted ATPase/Tfp pilus assembly protein PilF